jgi:hypothetical protein
MQSQMDDVEVLPLATELASAYHTMVACCRDQLGMSPQDADARARGADDTPEEAREDLDRIRSRPPDQVSWFDLNRIVERDPAAVTELWTALKAAARDELESGHRTARALNWAGRPWNRAQFLAIRDSFRADYQPAPGVESALVDVAAEAFGDYLAWSASLHMQADTEAELERHDLRRHGSWKPQRLSSAEAMSQSAQMADRAYTRFLRTVTTLAEMRRSPPEPRSHLIGSSTAVIVAPLVLPASGDDTGHHERM